ncbi:hypothetical protein ES705_23060 [subsurface metagenome]
MTEIIITNQPKPQSKPIVMTHERAIEILSDSAFRGMTTHGPDFKAALIKAIAALIAEKLNLER